MLISSLTLVNQNRPHRGLLEGRSNCCNDTVCKNKLEDPKTKMKYKSSTTLRLTHSILPHGKSTTLLRPLVRNAIRDSGIQRLNLTNAQYETEANNELRKAVKDYDINNPQGAQPKTFFLKDCSVISLK